jgi:4-carboxymuconolactone decarboxylase
MSGEDRLARGIRSYRRLRGETAAEPLIKAAEGNDAAGVRARYALEACFGDIWDRAGLCQRSRSLVTLGILIARVLPEELKNHFRIALRNGLTPDELSEVVLHATPYVGFPGTAFAVRCLEEVLQEPA